VPDSKRRKWPAKSRHGESMADALISLATRRGFTEPARLLAGASLHVVLFQLLTERDAMHAEFASGRGAVAAVLLHRSL